MNYWHLGQCILFCTLRVSPVGKITFWTVMLSLTLVDFLSIQELMSIKIQCSSTRIPCFIAHRHGHVFTCLHGMHFVAFSPPFACGPHKLFCLEGGWMDHQTTQCYSPNFTFLLARWPPCPYMILHHANWECRISSLLIQLSLAVMASPRTGDLHCESCVDSW